MRILLITALLFSTLSHAQGRKGINLGLCDTIPSNFGISKQS